MMYDVCVCMYIEGELVNGLKLSSKGASSLTAYQISVKGSRVLKYFTTHTHTDTDTHTHTTDTHTHTHTHTEPTQKSDQKQETHARHTSVHTYKPVRIPAQCHTPTHSRVPNYLTHTQITRIKAFTSHPHTHALFKVLWDERSRQFILVCSHTFSRTLSGSRIASLATHALVYTNHPSLGTIDEKDTKEHTHTHAKGNRTGYCYV